MQKADRSKMKSLTPKYRRLITDTVYNIQRVVISSKLPETIQSLLVLEMEKAVEACKRFLPEKHCTLYISNVPSLIRKQSQSYADSIGLNISISDEARKICARKLLEQKKAEEGKNETFLQILWIHLNLKDFRNDTNHIPSYVRSHLREGYRVRSDLIESPYAYLTRPEFEWLIDKIRAEIRRLEVIVQIHDTITELKNKPADDITTALLDRIIKLMAFMFKYKCCERSISYPLHYMKEAIHYEGENVNLTLMHALRLLKKKLKSHRLKGIEESSVELKLDSRPSSLDSSQELSSESARISLIDPLGSGDSMFNDEAINLCKIINSVSRFSYYTFATSTNVRYIH